MKVRRREPEDIVIDLKGLADTLYIMSDAFLNDNCFSADVMNSSLYYLALQIERLCDDVEVLEYPQNKLKALRAERGIGIIELADMSGISSDVICQIETGAETNLNTKDVAKLANALNVLPSEIFVA